MDVLCVGMYRACSTWQYEVASHLLERHRGGRRLGYVHGEQYTAIDRDPNRPVEWAVLKSHDEDPRFLPAMERGRAVALYAYRDLRDVAFSLAHKRGTTLEGVIRQGMLHQILANDRFWRAQPRDRILIQRYESLIADPAGGVIELARFLGLTLKPGEADAVASEYSMQANRQRTEEMSRRLVAQGIDLTDPANVQRCDGHTLLHWNHLREGRAGGWRDQSSPSQLALLGRIGARWLVDQGYEPDASWAGRLPTTSARLGLEVEAARSWLACAAGRFGRRHPQLARTARRLAGREQGKATAPPAPSSTPAVPAPHLPTSAAPSRTTPSNRA